ncbi:phosphotransferase [Arthrobacter sp. Br18]|uniref:phosphotransferase n=1 Tax=Arthrobacter sp. Br18 TaxID=1312954 RepID=UPI00047C6E93|nr:phosphotransferase [Arthrobacter sp. Br18]
MVKPIPGTVTDPAGRSATVHRAWPGRDGVLTFEARENDGGLVRAGFIDARDTVTLVPYGQDPVLAGLGTAAEAGDLLVHRYGKRAVVRVSDGYRKVLPPGKAASVASAYGRLRGLAAAAGVETPDVVATGPRSLTLSPVRGESFSTLGVEFPGKSGRERWEQAWELWTRQWPVLAVPPAGPALTVHSSADECATVWQWVSHCASFGQLRVEPAELKRAALHVEGLLLSGTPQPPVLAHRDLHDQQVFHSAEHGTIGLIDGDTLAIAEPALDLANLLVHLEFRRWQGLLSAAAEDTAAKAILDTASVMEVPEDRLRAYAASTRLRLACVYSFRPPYRELAEEWAKHMVGT